MKEKLIILFLFLGAFGFYARSAAPSVTAGDSGEFMTGALTLSLPHSPSFPTYVYSSRVFISLLPWGSQPYRVNLFSAFTGALSLVLLVLIARQWGASLLQALLLSLVLGSSASFLANSLVTEVFSLNVFLMLILIWLFKFCWEGSWAHIACSAFVLGIGVGNHQILVLVLPAYLTVLYKHRASLTFKRLGTAVLFGVLGFSIHASLMVRSRQNPPLNWGQPTNLSRLTRTITRKDYGSFTLALGEQPKRDAAHTFKHLERFSQQVGRELPWFVGLLGFAGLLLGTFKKDGLSPAALIVFVMTGPFFFLLGNLPFNDQSMGIMGRFFIMPVVCLLCGWLPLFRWGKSWAMIPLVGSLLLVAPSRWVEASTHRHTTLVLDYGRTMLRTAPMNSILFLDGGDDAFYSLALLHEGLGQRPDVAIHDRGGLIFKNIYGDDFRTLAKEAKKERRRQIENSFIGRRPVLYSTMDPNVLPGVTVAPVGILRESEPPSSHISWPLIIVRSLYPVEPNDYRSRSLAAFFPFTRAQAYIRQGDVDQGLRTYGMAWRMGKRVDWLKTNMDFDLSHLGYQSLVAGRYDEAEKIYLAWLQWEPTYQATSNLGVVYEKTGRPQLAAQAYQKAAELSPNLPDPVFNLASLAWAQKDWAGAVRYMEEVLRRDPNHMQARAYLEKARSHLQGTSR